MYNETRRKPVVEYRKWLQNGREINKSDYEVTGRASR